VKADERVCNMVAGFQTKNQSRSCIEDWLELARQVGRKADQYTIPVVLSGVYQGNHHHLKSGWRYTSTNLT